MENKRNRPEPYLIPAYYPPAEDEISLVDLWRVLRKRWKVIAGTTVLVIGLTVLYVLSQPRVYQAKIFLLPPKEPDVQVLTFGNISNISSSDVYKQYLNTSQSLTARRIFFDQQKLAEKLQPGRESEIATEERFEAFNKVLQVEPGKNSIFMTMTLEGSKPDDLAEWLNQYALYIDALTINEILTGIIDKLQNRKLALQNQVGIMREYATERRQDRIAVLDENAAIARKLGIITREDRVSVTSREGNNLGVAVNTASEPLYYRGYEELMAEKEALGKRENQDPFIAGLLDKEEEIALLDSHRRMLEQNRDQIHAVRIDRQALPPKSPIRPKRKMIVLLGGVLGLMGGLFLAFIMQFVENQKEEISSDLDKKA